MAYLNWKQNVGKGNFTPQEGEVLLKNFRYPPEIDDNGQLLIDIGSSKFVIGFKPNGKNSTWVGVTKFKLKTGTLILTIILLCLFILPGFIYSMSLNQKRKKIFIEAVKLMNQNLDKLN